MAVEKFLVSPTVLAGLIFVLWLIGGAIYRLWLSPLARFPGRRLAALTMWYEAYFQIVKQGKYVWEIERMHEQYGPIVRINPHELHIRDPEYYDDLYNFKKFDKYWWHVQQFGHPHSSANTVAHELHQKRRAAVGSYFSRGMIFRLEKEIIQKHIRILCDRLDEFQATQKPMAIGTAYRAFTTDVISDYTMAKPFDFLKMPDFNQAWFDAFLENVGMVHFICQFPWFPSTAKKLPSFLRDRLLPRTSQFIKFHHHVQGCVIATQERATNDFADSNANPTVFYEMFHADVPPEEKTVDRLTEEGILFVVAGNETTGNALSLITYHLLENTSALAKLKEELAEAIPDSSTIPQWQQLEELPFLSAVISEGLRMSYGVVSRMPRVCPNTTIQYKDWIIPPNTPVGMNNMDMHNNPDIFLEPLKFLPDRWLKPNANDLKKYLVPFCRGARACTGMNLAYAELYITIGTIFRRYDMVLFKSTRADVDVAHEFHIPQVKKGSKGVQVLIS